MSCGSLRRNACSSAASASSASSSPLRAFDVAMSSPRLLESTAYPRSWSNPKQPEAARLARKSSPPIRYGHPSRALFTAVRISSTGTWPSWLASAAPQFWPSRRRRHRPPADRIPDPTIRGRGRRTLWGRIVMRGVVIETRGPCGDPMKGCEPEAVFWRILHRCQDTRHRSVDRPHSER